MHHLVVIRGPIGAGKSTVATLLGRRLGRAGLAAAVVDLDDVAFMQSGVSLDELWRRAAIATGALVRAWFDAGTDVVIAHGPFFESDGYALLLGAQDQSVVVTHVLLQVPVDVALERVTAEESRGISKDPTFLRNTHERYAEIEPSLPAPDFVFDTTERPAADIASDLVAPLQPPT